MRLTDDMKRVIAEQRLAYVATVCADGTPNLSPKGTAAAWGDDAIVFADIRSPVTVANIARNPAMEINVVDPVSRKGYRFKGKAEVLREGGAFDEMLAFYRARGSRNRIRAIVRMRIERAAPLISPAYDLGQSEAEVRACWNGYWEELRNRG
ncbi:MAG: pyridoxamine 5'-phosphate oxidase family protein [Alphaproteobacteria bacterium]|nr:pyridoxamine 5'-phosphate oxidase family protein [Alphaproteobacteria bacterium]